MPWSANRLTSSSEHDAHSSQTTVATMYGWNWEKYRREDDANLRPGKKRSYGYPSLHAQRRALAMRAPSARERSFS